MTKIVTYHRVKHMPVITVLEYSCVFEASQGYVTRPYLKKKKTKRRKGRRGRKGGKGREAEEEAYEHKAIKNEGYITCRKQIHWRPSQSVKQAISRKKYHIFPQ